MDQASGDKPAANSPGTVCCHSCGQLRTWVLHSFTGSTALTLLVMDRARGGCLQLANQHLNRLGAVAEPSGNANWPVGERTILGYVRSGQYPLSTVWGGHPSDRDVQRSGREKPVVYCPRRPAILLYG